MTNSIYSGHDSHQIKNIQQNKMREKVTLQPVHRLYWNFISATKRYTLL